MCAKSDSQRLGLVVVPQRYGDNALRILENLRFHQLRWLFTFIVHMQLKEQNVRLQSGDELESITEITGCTNQLDPDIVFEQMPDGSTRNITAVYQVTTLWASLTPSQRKVT